MNSAEVKVRRKYERAIDIIHAKYYPHAQEPLVGERQAYLDAWGQATKEYFAEMKALGFKNYEWKE